MGTKAALDQSIPFVVPGFDQLNILLQYDDRQSLAKIQTCLLEF